MCCMWSTDDPPDVIEGPEPFCDSEAGFDIAIDPDDALALYDMTSDEAAQRIRDMKERNCLPSLRFL